MLNIKIADFASGESVSCLLNRLYAGIFSFEYENNLDIKLRIASKIDDNYSEYEFINEEG